MARTWKERLDWQSQGDYFRDISAAFPTTLVLAKLANHVYNVEASFDDKDPDLKGWRVLEKGPKPGSKYVAAAYINDTDGHIVIAHKGTSPNSGTDLSADIKAISRNKNHSRIATAYHFTQKIVDEYYDKNFSTSVTGHSLGGWMAQTSTFYVENAAYRSAEFERSPGKQRHLHTVTFESPGCRQAMDRISGNDKRYDLKKCTEVNRAIISLDITNIVTKTNIINSPKEHVGYVLKLRTEISTSLLNPTRSHQMSGIISALEANAPIYELYDTRLFRKQILDSEKTDLANSQFLTKESECWFNVFNSEEQKFLNQFNELNQLKKGNDPLDMDLLKGKEDLLYILNEMPGFDIVHERVFLRTNEQNKLFTMEQFITFIKCLLKRNAEWKGRNFLCEIIKANPSWKNKFYEIQSRKFMKQIPILKQCQTPNLLDQFESFLRDQSQILLQVNVPKGVKGMASTAHVNRTLSTIFEMSQDEVVKNAGAQQLFLNMKSLYDLSQNLELESICSDTRNVGLVVIECMDTNRSSEELVGKVISAFEQVNRIQELKTMRKLIVINYFSLIQGKNVWSNEIYFPSSNSESGQIKYEYLSTDSQEVVLNAKFQINKEVVRLKDLLNDSDPKESIFEDLGTENICKIFKGEVVCLSHSTNEPDRIEFYINRHVGLPLLDFTKLVGFKDEIVVCCNMADIEKIDQSLRRNNFEGVYYFDSNICRDTVIKRWESLPKSVNSHCFSWNGSDLIYMSSRLKPCSEYLRSEKISELQLLKLNSKFLIIADEPGMGKSACIANLYAQPSECSDFVWKIYIDLNRCKSFIDEVTNYDLEDFVTFVAKTIGSLPLPPKTIKSINSTFLPNALKFCLTHAGNVHIFMDSFDEISNKQQTTVLSMLNTLKSSDYKFKMWIATRLHLSPVLADTLGVKPTFLHKLTEVEQVSFLTEYFGNLQISNADEENSEVESTLLKDKYKDQDDHFKEYVECALKEIRKVLGEKDSFIGIPLQLKMLATVQETAFQKYIRTVSISGENPLDFVKTFDNIVDLYKLFVDEKFRISLEEKEGSSGLNNDRKEKLFNDFEACMSDIACALLFPNNEDYFEIPAVIDHSHVREAVRSGICQANNNETEFEALDSFQFIHQTLAEYFVSKRLVRLLNREDSNQKILKFLKDEYYKSEFNQIRYFLDSTLCTKISVLKSLRYLNTLDEQGDMSGLDVLGRSILHYAAAYGNHEEGIYWIIAKNTKLTNKQDQFGATWQYYLIFSNFLDSIKFAGKDLSKSIKYFKTCFNVSLEKIHIPFLGSTLLKDILQCLNQEEFCLKHGENRNVRSFKNQTKSVLDFLDPLTVFNLDLILNWVVPVLNQEGGDLMDLLQFLPAELSNLLELNLENARGGLTNSLKSNSTDFIRSFIPELTTSYDNWERASIEERRLLHNDIVMSKYQVVLTAVLQQNSKHIQSLIQLEITVLKNEGAGIYYALARIFQFCACSRNQLYCAWVWKFLPFWLRPLLWDSMFNMKDIIIVPIESFQLDLLASDFNDIFERRHRIWTYYRCSCGRNLPDIFRVFLSNDNLFTIHNNVVDLKFLSEKSKNLIHPTAFDICRSWGLTFSISNNQKSNSFKIQRADEYSSKFVNYLTESQQTLNSIGLFSPVSYFWSSSYQLSFAIEKAFGKFVCGGISESCKVVWNLIPVSDKTGVWKSNFKFKNVALDNVERDALLNHIETMSMDKEYFSEIFKDGNMHWQVTNKKEWNEVKVRAEIQESFQLITDFDYD